MALEAIKTLECVAKKLDANEINAAIKDLGALLKSVTSHSLDISTINDIASTIIRTFQNPMSYSFIVEETTISLWKTYLPFVKSFGKSISESETIQGLVEVTNKSLSSVFRTFLSLRVSYQGDFDETSDNEDRLLEIRIAEKLLLFFGQRAIMNLTHLLVPKYESHKSMVNSSPNCIIISRNVLDMLVCDTQLVFIEALGGLSSLELPSNNNNNNSEYQPPAKPIPPGQFPIDIKLLKGKLEEMLLKVWKATSNIASTPVNDTMNDTMNSTINDTSTHSELIDFNSCGMHKFVIKYLLPSAPHDNEKEVPKNDEYFVLRGICNYNILKLKHCCGYLYSYCYKADTSPSEDIDLVVNGIRRHVTHSIDEYTLTISKLSWLYCTYSTPPTTTTTKTCCARLTDELLWQRLIKGIYVQELSRLKLLLMLPMTQEKRGEEGGWLSVKNAMTMASVGVDAHLLQACFAHDTYNEHREHTLDISIPFHRVVYASARHILGEYILLTDAICGHRGSVCASNSSSPLLKPLLSSMINSLVSIIRLDTSNRSICGVECVHSLIYLVGLLINGAVRHVCVSKALGGEDSRINGSHPNVNDNNTKTVIAACYHTEVHVYMTLFHDAQDLLLSPLKPMATDTGWESGGGNGTQDVQSVLLLCRVFLQTICKVYISVYQRTNSKSTQPGAITPVGVQYLSSLLKELCASYNVLMSKDSSKNNRHQNTSCLSDEENHLILHLSTMCMSTYSFVIYTRSSPSQGTCWMNDTLVGDGHVDDNLCTSIASVFLCFTEQGAAQAPPSMLTPAQIELVRCLRCVLHPSKTRDTGDVADAGFDRMFSMEYLTQHLLVLSRYYHDQTLNSKEGGKQCALTIPLSTMQRCMTTIYALIQWMECEVCYSWIVSSNIPPSPSTVIDENTSIHIERLLLCGQYMSDYISIWLPKTSSTTSPAVVSDAYSMIPSDFGIGCYQSFLMLALMLFKHQKSWTPNKDGHADATGNMAELLQGLKPSMHTLCRCVHNLTINTRGALAPPLFASRDLSGHCPHSLASTMILSSIWNIKEHLPIQLKSHLNTTLLTPECKPLMQCFGTGRTAILNTSVIEAAGVNDTNNNNNSKRTRISVSIVQLSPQTCTRLAATMLML